MEDGLQKILDAIVAKELHELTENDKGILRARQDYIGRSNRKKFAAVLGEKNPETKEEPAQVDFEVKDPFTPAEDDGADE